jgi:alpha-mannosidase
MVFNPASRPARGVVEFNGRTVWCPDVPAVGARTLTPAELSAVCPVAEAVSIAADERTRTAELFGGGVRVRVDALGRVVGLRVGDGPELCAQNTPMNELVLSEDRPRMWDAWDVDREHLASQVVQASAATRWRVVESAPHFVGVEVTRPIGERSTIVQTIGLSAGSKAVLVRTRVDWRERHRLLRALFPATVERARWLTSTHGGHLERPTHTNTTWEHAAFEVPCQRWTALTGATSAVGVINDSRFGCGLARGDVQSLSLLRSPTYPDPEADQGEHTFTYGLVPAFAPGGFVPGEPVATIDAAAERLNRPLRAVALAVGQEGRAWAPIDLAGSPGWVVDALKPAEDGGAVVLRLHDSLGLGGTLKVRWTLPVSSVQPVNLLEEPMALGGFGHDETSRTTTLSTHPFQVVTLRATLG